MDKHKPMKIPNRICETNIMFFVTDNPGKACRLEFADNLLLPFLDKSQSDVVFLQ